MISDIIEGIVKALVDNPDSVQINQESGEKTLSLNISCDRSDIGKIIGKSGKTISAIRTIAKIISSKNGKKITITIID
jgi:hypothetical protein